MIGLILITLLVTLASCSSDARNLPANMLFEVPNGYSQRVVWDELGLYTKGPDLFPGQNDHPDMNQVNETGPMAGRFLYRTHEVRDVPSGAALSVTDLTIGETKLLAQRPDGERLDGLKWTPWGTLLFAEEVVDAKISDPDSPASESGLLYELFLEPDDPSTPSDILVRPAVGSMSHEGIGIDSSGNMYVVDEFEKGGICKFVPDSYGDLSSGQLFVLGTDDNDFGFAIWVSIDRQKAPINARIAAVDAGGSKYDRPEDVEIIDNILYVAITGENRVISIDLEGSSPIVKNFVSGGKVLGGRSGFSRPDNLASDGNGNLYIVEDNSPGDIWIATPDKDGDGQADEVVVFATLTAKAEPTGLYFAKDSNIAYVNVQDAADGNDMTIAIGRQ